MRITTKVILGFSAMLVISVTAYLYQGYLLERLQRANRGLSEIGFETGLRSFQAYEDLRDLEEFTSKYLVSRESFYRTEAEALKSEISDELGAVLKWSMAEEALYAKAQQLLDSWLECRRLLENVKSETGGATSENEIGKAFQSVFRNLESMTKASDRYLASASVQAEAMRERVTLVSRLALGIALFLAILVSFLVYRSISGPLRIIAQGTRRIAEGDFTARVDESGGHELAELASVLNQMTRQLQELDQLKKDFVSNVSHDLRAPLASIQETTGLILDELSEGLSDVQKRLLRLNLSSAGRLSEMIGDLLDISRLEAGAVDYEFEEFGIRDWVEDAVESFHGLLIDKELTLEAHVPFQQLSIRGDRSRLLQVLNNLLSNAIKFSPPGGRIDVSVERFGKESRKRGKAQRNTHAARSAGLFLVAVSDQGPGIPVDAKGRVFDRFFSAAGRQAHGRRGTGLGLAIAKKIIEAHDGSIWVEDNPNGTGSRFSMLLPGVP